MESAEFKELDERIVPILANVYEVHIVQNYRLVKAIRFINARRLGTQIEYKIYLSVNGLKEGQINNVITSISAEYLEGKDFKTKKEVVRFLKNSFEVKDDRKVEPKKEEKVVVVAEFKITCKLIF